jgi:hypothetical protein
MRQFFNRTIIASSLMLSGVSLAACPLEGTWDTGFVQSKFGGSFYRVIQTFDCAGNTRMQAFTARGKMMEAMGEVVERSGTYTLGSQSSGQDVFPVDVRISTVTRRFLDTSSLELAKDRNGCAPESASLLVPFDTRGIRCSDTLFPSAGYIERAVVKIAPGRLFWSLLHGTDKLIIQKPGEAPERRLLVDEELPFLKVEQP